MVDKYYPFVKNRYYYGKLLTTSDLEAEQGYINGKRRFINKTIFGQGKICGLKVYPVSENTVMVESGFAIDEAGREIIVDKSEIKKLASIDGFDEVKSDKMLLTIKYNESFSQPVYSITKNNNGQEYEYNRINEGYKLMLKEYEDLQDVLNIEDELIYNKEIYNDGNYKVVIKMPTLASTNSGFKFVTLIEKLSDIEDEISVKYTISTPRFVKDDNSETALIDMKNVNIDKGKFILNECWVTPNNMSFQDKTTFMIKKEDIEIAIGNKQVSINENILFPINVYDNDPIELVKTKVKNEPLEEIMQRGLNKDIVIAIISIVRTGANYIIQDVSTPIESKYSPQMPSQTPFIEKILNYFKDDDKKIFAQEPVKIIEKDDKNADMDFKRRISTVVSSGVFELPLGLNVKANKAILSDEIMHNLGPGDVCVNVGFEFITSEAEKKDSFIKKIIFGDPEIFKEHGIVMPSVTTAVQVICEKGAFVVGVKFAQATNLVSVKVRWFAYKKADHVLDALDYSTEDRGIYVKQDTIKLIPNEVHFIEIGFRNINPTAVRYEVVDKDGGEIDENGVYTAPNKDGVYEIKISCINEPSMYTFAYAIVMKKDAEQK